MTATSDTGSVADRRRVIGSVVCELERITGAVDSARSREDRARIEELEREVAQLRAVVAHLRAGTAGLPRRLRPVVARAVLQDGAAAAPGATPVFDPLLWHSTDTLPNPI